MGVNFFITVESGGQIVGSGPITSVSSWEQTLRMDRAGSFSFAMPASDPKAELVQLKRIVHFHALLIDTWIEVGAGIIDKIDYAPDNNGQIVMTVTGDDLVRELDYRSVGFLKLEDGSSGPVSHATAVGLIDNSAPPGWTFLADATPPVDQVYGQFAGELVLAAVVVLAERTQTHFRMAASRVLEFFSGFTPSGVRAVRAQGSLAPGTCAITNVSESVDYFDLITRIYPFGSGTGNARLTLAASNAGIPAGYTGNIVENWIQRTDVFNLYGLIERRLEFKDIAPLSNTDADLAAAANALLAAAKIEVDSRSQPTRHFTLSVAECDQVLQPGQTIWVDYRDDDRALDIRQELNIIESTFRIDESGLHTTSLVVSDSDKALKTDNDIIVGRMAEAKIFQAHPQLNANTYTTGYNKNMDDVYEATFRFRFGNEVVQLNQVMFEFQLLPFESTVKSIGSTTATTSSGGSATPTSSGGSSHSHPIPNHQHRIAIANGTSGTPMTITQVGADWRLESTVGTVNVLTEDDSGGTTSDSESVHSHTVTIPAHSHTVTPVITSLYGIFREIEDNTYTIDELDYGINGSIVATLGTDAIDIGGGWYQLDITGEIMDSTTFRPLFENNLITIQAKTTASHTITSINGDGTTIVIQTTPAADSSLIGRRILIAGASGFNGYFTIDNVDGSNNILIAAPNTGSGSAGTIRVVKTVNIDALLSVRNIIQAINYAT